jgi:hypothetical protein
MPTNFAYLLLLLLLLLVLFLCCCWCFSYSASSDVTVKTEPPTSAAVMSNSWQQNTKNL